MMIRPSIKLLQKTQGSSVEYWVYFEKINKKKDF